MIYTCFFNQAQLKNVHRSPVYKQFGLEPEVNAEITRNCDELKDPIIRLQLTEYGCLLWHWRNKEMDNDFWFGITSHRQADKTNVFFDNDTQLVSICDQRNIATWGLCKMKDRQGKDISLAKQAEACHPGITQFIADIYAHFGDFIPEDWNHICQGIFANYWAMHKDDFYNFMAYSWPRVEYAISLLPSHSYTNTKISRGRVTSQKALGYFVERLFILWYLKTGKEIVNIGRTLTIYNRVRG